MMASVSRDAAAAAIQFVGLAGSRQAIRWGGVPVKHAGGRGA